MVVFTENSPYKKRAKYSAIGWTLLIFILCFLPGNELPNLKIPFIDKWAHIILFAVFAFLWMCAYPSSSFTQLVLVVIVTVFDGWLVEYIQGHYVSGRFQDDMDTLADAVGGVVGAIIFYMANRVAHKRLM